MNTVERHIYIKPQTVCFISACYASQKEMWIQKFVIVEEHGQEIDFHMDLWDQKDTSTGDFSDPQDDMLYELYLNETLRTPRYSPDFLLFLKFFEFWHADFWLKSY